MPHQCGCNGESTFQRPFTVIVHYREAVAHMVDEQTLSGFRIDFGADSIDALHEFPKSICRFPRLALPEFAEAKNIYVYAPALRHWTYSLLPVGEIYCTV